jgi:sulfhydrogenase subunit delta
MPTTVTKISGRRPRLAVHKFSSCDGCQLALLNAGDRLLALAEMVDIVHFAEAGVVDEQAEADFVLVEGSISTPAERDRIREIRARSRWLIPMGACATAGGPQALRNLADATCWLGRVYPHPEQVEMLPGATPISDHVKVDLRLVGCPVDTRQVLGAIRSLLSGAKPAEETEKVCMECKRLGHICVLITAGEPCLGPVTVSGCGALCPGLGRGCYGCYGPGENVETASLTRWMAARGMGAQAIAHRFMYQNSGAKGFREALTDRSRGSDDDDG